MYIYIYIIHVCNSQGMNSSLIQRARPAAARPGPARPGPAQSANLD